jgi:hypothetical protein
MVIWNIHTTAISYSLWPRGNLMAIGYISSRFGILNKEKSGNPDHYKHKNILIFTE